MGQSLRYDNYAPAIAAANANAKAAGLADRLCYEICDVTNDIPGAYDFITTFDVVHDMPRPHPALAEIKRSFKPDGSYTIIDMLSSLTDGRRSIPIGVATKRRRPWANGRRVWQKRLMM